MKFPYFRPGTHSICPLLYNYFAGIMKQKTTEYPERWREEYVIVIVLLPVLVIVSLLVMLMMYRKRLKTRVTPSIFSTNGMTNLSDNEQSTAIDIRPNIGMDSQMCNAEHVVASTVETTSILPEWLLNKKDMIYSDMYIEQQEKLGSGQFGTVFKGRLKQGNAV